MPIEQSALDDQVAESASFLARVLGRRIDVCRIEGQDGFLTIHLENPYQPDRPIIIDTRNAEITLRFGECHSHFFESDGSSAAWLVGEMVEAVVGIVGGGTRSYSAHAGDLCLGGGWLRAGEDSGDMIESFSEATRFKVAAWAPWDDLEVTRPQFHSRLQPPAETDEIQSCSSDLEGES